LTGWEDSLRALTVPADHALIQLRASASVTDPGQVAADSLVNLSQDAGLTTRLIALGAVRLPWT
jgi:hypothetical protein